MPKPATLVSVLLVLIAIGIGTRIGHRTPDRIPAKAPADPAPGSVTTPASAETGSMAGPTLATGSPIAQNSPLAQPSASTPRPPMPPWVRPSERRPWDPSWLDQFAGKTTPSTARFELTGGRIAEGDVIHIREEEGVVVFVGGRLRQPEAGTFFFRKQGLTTAAGSHVGVIQLPGSHQAFRLEPAQDGSIELVARSLDEVVCVSYRKSGETAAAQRSEDAVIEEAAPIDMNQHPSVPVPEYQNGVPMYQSQPGAKGVLYMDFDGETTTEWNGQLIVAKKSSFTTTQIRDTWRIVAADFQPFTINVTTDLQVFQKAAQNSRIRVIVTPTDDAQPGAGGVSFVGAWNWTGDTPSWAFNLGSSKELAETITHEVGHALGLRHDNRQPPNGAYEEYYMGHGSGETSWAPIMGAGVSKSVIQWSQGEYANAVNKEDDLAIITTQNNSVAYRVDDFGSTWGSAAQLEIFPGGAVTNRGLIERNTDADVFRFTTSGGRIDLQAAPAVTGANLAIQMDLLDPSEQVLLRSSPTSTLKANFATNVPPGDYAIRIRGAGRGPNATIGFTAYGSLGYYSITGVAGGASEPLRFRIPENPTNNTVIGSLDSLATGPANRRFVATRGNGVGPFAVSSIGELTVADSSPMDFEAREWMELFVNIEYPDDPSLNQSDLRVVVQFTNVNEPSVITTPLIRVFDRTRSGTVLGQVSATDPDLFSALTFAVGSGNEEGYFAITGTGELRLAKDLDSGPKTFVLGLDVADRADATATTASEIRVEVLETPTGLAPGAVTYAVYSGISGNTVAALTGDPSYPNSPSKVSQLTVSEITPNFDTDFGAVLQGYFLAPVTGSYTFAVSGDDATDLRLGTSQDPSTVRRIAYAPKASDPKDWTQYVSQKSSAISLVGGRAYYMEARLKAADGISHLAVAWQCAAAGASTLQVIPGRFLAPYTGAFVPRLVTTDVRLRHGTFPHARFAKLEASSATGGTDFQFELVSSSVEGLVSVEKSTGWLRLADAAMLESSSDTEVSLEIRVSDSTGGASTGSVVCRILGAEEIGTPIAHAEIFQNIGTGTSVANLTGNAKFPGRPDLLLPLEDLAVGPNIGQSYGTRIRALLAPPVSGSYTFYIASDDSSELWLSTSSSPSNAKVIARVGGAVAIGNWTGQTGQKSASVNLLASRQYYLEVLHKEGAGNDHLAVAWTNPNTPTPVVIPGSALRPVALGTAPILSPAEGTVERSAGESTLVVDVNATDSPLDVLAWRIRGGNDEGIFRIDTDTGAIAVAKPDTLKASAQSAWNLEVEVQDSGYGDLYPRLTSTTTVPITVKSALSPFAEWAVAAGIPGEGPDGDSDNDQASNELEFAFGGDPRKPDAVLLLPRVSTTTVGGTPRIQLRHFRRLDSTSIGMAYKPLSLTRLAPEGWAPAEILSTTTRTGEGIPAGYEEVTYEMADDVETRFFRVSVSTP